MRSIRLSLIVYFLLLLAAALGGVSWLVYHNAAKTLHDKHVSTRKLIENTFENDCQKERAKLDQRIVEQARQVLSKARSTTVPLEHLYMLGAIGAPSMPFGYLNMPLWIAETTYPPIAFRLYRARPLDIIIDQPEDLVWWQDEDDPKEYFQIYRWRGQVMQRSESLGDHSFVLDENIRDHADLLVEHFDDVELPSGQKIRRVTFKASVPRFKVGALPYAWRYLAFGPKGWPGGGGGPGGAGPGMFGGKSGNNKSPGKGNPPPPPRVNVFESTAPVIFVQYASDTGPMEERIAQYQSDRDQQLGELEVETRETLQSLRANLLSICGAAFLGILAGGFFLVRLGLKPLDRLSEAVSQVSAKDMRLKLDLQRLPVELQPVATRLAETLKELQRAFDREKQASADISHELRTPLAAMMTNLELALRKSRTAEEYRELLEDIRSSGQQMSHLVERLLALARLDAGATHLKSQTIDAADVARQCAHLVRPLAEARGLDLRLHAPESLPLQSDPDKLREILNNLLHNAIEYNRPQGAIDITAARVNGHVRLAVKDTGIGITPEARERIFERFFRADPSRHADSPHAGLGLSIVKSYLDLMGGSIQVESNGQGSTFIVNLPVLPE